MPASATTTSPTTLDNASAAETPAARGAERTLLQWSVRAGQGRTNSVHMLYAAALVALGVIVIAGAFADTDGGIVIAAVLGGAALLSLEDLVWPCRHRLTTRGVYSRLLVRHSFMPWSTVRRCTRDATGVKLSPFAKRSRFDALRGIYLRVNDADGATVEELVRLVKQYRPGGDRRADGVGGADNPVGPKATGQAGSPSPPALVAASLVGATATSEVRDDA